MSLAAPRKPRKHPAIISSKKAFSDAIKNRDYEAAARIVFSSALEVLGVNGLMKALDQGNRFYQRKEQRTGL